MMQCCKLYSLLNSRVNNKSLVQIDLHEFDKNEFLLNTPSWTYDLRKGLSDIGRDTRGLQMGAEITEEELKCVETMFKRLRGAVGDKETEMYKDRIIGALELILFREQEE